MLLFASCDLWSIIGDSGFVVSSIVSSVAALLSFHVLTGKMGTRPWLINIRGASSATGSVACAMMEMRHAEGQQKGRRGHGLCRGAGSGDRPPTPAGPRGLSHPQAAIPAG